MGRPKSKQYATGRAFLLDLINDPAASPAMKLKAASSLLASDRRAAKTVRAEAAEAVTAGPYAVPAQPKRAS